VPGGLGWVGKERKGREGKGREGKGREGKGKERKGKEFWQRGGLEPWACSGRPPYGEP